MSLFHYFFGFYHVTLHEPNSRELPAKSKVKLRLSSQYLRQIMVENIPLECDENGTWEGKITTPQSDVIIYISAFQKIFN
jgi:hypothetical protein